MRVVRREHVSLTFFPPDDSSKYSHGIHDSVRFGTITHQLHTLHERSSERDHPARCIDVATVSSNSRKMPHGGRSVAMSTRKSTERRWQTFFSASNIQPEKYTANCPQNPGVSASSAARASSHRQSPASTTCRTHRPQETHHAGRSLIKPERAEHGKFGAQLRPAQAA